MIDRCPSKCKGAMPEMTPELIKALDTIIEYYRDFHNEIGCEKPSAQCFIVYMNNLLYYKSIFDRESK